MTPSPLRCGHHIWKLPRLTPVPISQLRYQRERSPSSPPFMQSGIDEGFSLSSSSFSKRRRNGRALKRMKCRRRRRPSRAGEEMSSSGSFRGLLRRGTGQAGWAIRPEQFRQAAFPGQIQSEHPVGEARRPFRVSIYDATQYHG